MHVQINLFVCVCACKNGGWVDVLQSKGGRTSKKEVEESEKSK